MEDRCDWIVDYLNSFGKIPLESSCSHIPVNARYDMMDNNLNIIHCEATFKLGVHVVGTSGVVGSSLSEILTSLNGFREFFGNVLCAKAFAVLEGVSFVNFF